MIRALLLLAALSLHPVGTSALEPLPPEVDAAFQLGVHAVVGCESCHWEEPDKTPRTGIPALCGDCHPGAQEDHAASVHWSDTEAHAVCTDCHGIHGILPVADPQSKAHRSLVCGQCHPGPMEELASGPHGAAFENTKALVCASCHSNHAVLRPSFDVVDPACISCHTRETGAYAFGQQVSDQFSTLREQLAETAGAISRAEAAGLETRRAVQLLRASESQFTQARLAWHSLKENRIEENVEKASLTAVGAASRIQEAIDTQKVREYGIVVMWIVILLAALGLHLKRKSLEA